MRAVVSVVGGVSSLNQDRQWRTHPSIVLLRSQDRRPLGRCRARAPMMCTTTMAAPQQERRDETRRDDASWGIGLMDKAPLSRWGKIGMLETKLCGDGMNKNNRALELP